jgi:1-phosphofructokinase family hexose kinase
VIHTLTLHPAIDRVLRAPGFGSGGLLRSELVALLAAGKGFNVSRNLALLGAGSVAAGLVGAPDVAFYAQSFEALGVETLLEPCPAPTRCNITVSDPESGGSVHLREKGSEVPAGALDRLRRRLLPRLAAGDTLAICGSLPSGTGASDLESLLDDARAAGASTLLDSSGEALRFSAGRGPDTLKINDRELAELTGRPAGGLSAAVEAAGRALDLGPQLVLVTLGARGAVCARREGVLHAAAREVWAVNGVGAGDAFCAGFLWKSAQGIETAMRYAVACGAVQAASECIGRLERAAVEEAVAGVTMCRL